MGDLVKHCKATLVIKQLEKALEIYESEDDRQVYLHTYLVMFCLEAGIERVKLEQLRGECRSTSRANPVALCGEIIPFRLS